MSKLKNYLKELEIWKQALWGIIIIGGPVITTLLLIWLFSLHGTLGIFLWHPLFFSIIVILGIFAVLGFSFALLNIFLPNRRESKLFSILRKCSWIFCITCLITSVSFIGYVGPKLTHTAGSTAPQILICDGEGENGIPKMAVTFWTERPTTNTLKWGNESLSKTITEEKATHQHAFILDKLNPDTEYWYQINEEGEIYNFTTASEDNDKLRLAITSDAHFGRSESRPGITRDILKEVTDPGNSFDSLFFLGDLVEYGFMDSQWKQFLDSVSPYTTRIPFRTLCGNHDTIFGGVKYYKDYLYPEKMPTDTGSRLYYRIDINNVHIFALNLEWGLETYTAEQKEWLESEIAKVEEDDWTIVMSHSFFYSSGSVYGFKSWADQPDMLDAFEDLFIENDVDLVFSGHNHHVEVLEKEGIYYQIVGAAGAVPDPKADTISDASEWYMNIETDSEFGFFEVDIDGNNATLNYRNKNYDSLYNITIEE
ncbi:MAG: metallophosphoesterase [Promethearchaeia archaeon]